MAETPETTRPYEPPRIERVFTPDDLEREIMYAATDLFSTDETTT